MDRQQYNACIGDKMRGQKLSKQERKAAFCVAAKVCSGKAGSEEEALKICSMPKSPKAGPSIASQETASPIIRKSRVPRHFMIMCKDQGFQRAECLLGQLESSGMAITDEFRQMVINAEVECQCQR